jgi:hypothetical protein
MAFLQPPSTTRPPGWARHAKSSAAGTKKLKISFDIRSSRSTPGEVVRSGRREGRMQDGREKA